MGEGKQGSPPQNPLLQIQSLGKGKQGWMIPPQNPLLQIQSKLKELENGYECWVTKQPLYIEAALSTARGAARGAALGLVVDHIMDALSPVGQVCKNDAIFGVATVTFGVNAGISTVLKRLKGKEDVQSSMTAAFGSGAMFSLVTNMGERYQPAKMVTFGLLFALFQGGRYKVEEKFSKPQEEDPSYMKTKGLLKNLGLDTYEKNFKKGMLNDYTLPLLTDSALRDMKIPPGPRLVILDHIQRDPEISQRPKTWSPLFQT